MSPKVLPAHKGGRGEQDQDAGSAFLHATQQRVEIPLDQSDRKAIEALMEQIRHNEAYVAEMSKYMTAMGKALVELMERKKTLDQEQVRWSKWNADNAARIIQLDGHVSEDAKESKSFTNERLKEVMAFTLEAIQERLKAVEDYVNQQKCEERSSSIDDMLANHNFYVGHLWPQRV